MLLLATTLVVAVLLHGAAFPHFAEFPAQEETQLLTGEPIAIACTAGIAHQRELAALDRMARPDTRPGSSFADRPRAPLETRLSLLDSMQSRALGCLD